MPMTLHQVRVAAVKRVLDDAAYHCVDCIDDEQGTKPVKTLEQWQQETAVAIVQVLSADPIEYSGSSKVAATFHGPANDR